MAENNYRDDFENFLKENTDDFRMIPNKKVWYSIYNGMHPDRRWPSITVCLLILLTVLYIGIANNNSISHAARNAKEENFSASLAEKGSSEQMANPNNLSNNTKKNTFEKLISKNDNLILIYTEKNLAASFPKKEYALLGVKNSSGSKNASNDVTTKKEELTKNIVTTDSKINIAIINSIAVENNEGLHNKLATVANQQNEEEILLTAQIKKTADLLIAENLAKAEIKEKTLKNNLLIIEKSWKEDYAFRNKPAINKFKQHADITYYVTPSVGYRDFSKTNKSLYAGSLLVTNGYNDDGLHDRTALNLEAGLSINYKIAKQLRLKFGIQSNYSNYVSRVTELTHPTQATLAVNSKKNNLRIANYSTEPGKIKLNKSSLQLSLPIGADVKIAGNDKWKWYIGATLQPTFIISGKSYVLSEDERHYIAEPSLLRKINLNTALETFVSFKPTSGVLLSVGPQFRYQLLSTYKSTYNYTEKLYNVGVKLGISTTF